MSAFITNMLSKIVVWLLLVVLSPVIILLSITFLLVGIFEGLVTGIIVAKPRGRK